MTIAAKHFDPIVGIDIHIILMPPAATPTPLPNPFVGIVLDPIDYIPKIGATVRINGLPRAQAGTMGLPLIPHLPLGGPFGPPPPSHDAEIFMGSSTVAIDGDAQSYLGLPVLSCQSIGIPSPPRLKKAKKPAKSFVLPTSVVLSIPMGPPVMVGGSPTISLTALGMRGALAALGPLGKGLRKLQRGKGGIGKAMRAITRRANRAGDALASALRLGARGRNRISRAICTVTGHPIDVATGKVFTDKVDFELPGPIPLRWERVWYSTSTYRGPLGHGWHCSYDAALYVADDVVLYRAPDGRSIAFPPLASGGEHFDRAEKLTLLRDTLGYAVQSGELLYRFRDIGLPDGERVLSSIGDRAGHTIQLHHDDRGRLARIVDSAGRLIELAHDAEGRIAAVTAPHPDDEGERFTVVQYAYDHDNLVRVLDALKAPFRYRYRHALLVQETDRNGLSFHFEYDGKDENARCIRTHGDGGLYDHKLSYDELHGITTVENSLGQKTQHQHEGGLVVRTVDALGGITSFEYDEYGGKLKQIDPLGRATQFEHDDRGNVVRIVKPDGAATIFEHDAQDRPTCVRDALGGCFRYRYDDQGRLVERTDPLERSMRFEHAGGLLLYMYDRAGHTTGVDYDGHGNVAALHAPDDTTRRWRYDGLGRVIEAVDEAGNVQRRTYDLLGRMTRVDEPDGNTRHFTYDGEGNVLHARDDQHDVRLEHCGLGRLAARTEAGTTVRFEYDTEEQLTGVVNQHGHVYRYELGPRGEVEVEHGFDGIRRAYRRDLAGQPIAITRASGDVSRYRYDRAGRVTAIEHADGTKEAYAYRADGALISAQNATTTVAFQRDLLGRIVRETQGGHWVESQYDMRGDRIRMRSSLGADQRIERDVMGRAIGVHHATSDAGEPFEARLQRDLFGLELERTLPGGLRSRWRRDNLGHPLEHEVDVRGRTLRTRRYAWEANDRLVSIIDALQGAVQFGHDALGQLAWARFPDGTAELRMPDAVGNLFRREDRSDRRYSPAGQLLESVDEHGRTTAFAYDAEGNLIEKRRSTGECWRYRWGADGMLREVDRPDGSVVRFGYDALGRRVYKRYRGQTTRFVWDGHVPLHEWVEGVLEPLADAGAEPAWLADAAIKVREAALRVHVTRGPPERGSVSEPITWLFEPGSFAPMAKLSAQGQRAILTDHNGTPSMMLDDQGAVTWSAEIGVWGELRQVEGDRFACPFRWPGQYEDAETGLYYNRFRYYDPEAGEYVSQDPIGFGGGGNFAAYVQDPLTFVDPLGLACGKMHVFWSGGGNPRVQQAAMRWAREHGAVTLEMTGRGSQAARHAANLDWIEAEPIWKKLSTHFAKHSPGDTVHVFLNRSGISPNSVWLTVEHDILEHRGVTIIAHLID